MFCSEATTRESDWLEDSDESLRVEAEMGEGIVERIEVVSYGFGNVYQADRLVAVAQWTTVDTYCTRTVFSPLVGRLHIAQTGRSMWRRQVMYCVQMGECRCIEVHCGRSIAGRRV